MVKYRTLVAALIAIGMSSPLYSADGPEESSISAADIAKELANPNTTQAFLAFALDYVKYDGDAPGASSQDAWRLNFQPSFPYPLNETTNFFLRPLIPVYLDQPVPVVGDQSIASENFEGTGLELGDISFDAAIGRTFASGTVLIGGVVGTLPTATDDRVGLDQYLLGPELLVGQATSWGFIGALLTHQWDVAGEDDYDTSITGGQYFYTVNLKNAWQIQATPTFSYNHEASSGDRWTLPLGVGVSKTVVRGTTPWKFSLQYWHYVESPDAFGPDYQIRFQVTPVVPLPW